MSRFPRLSVLAISALALCSVTCEVSQAPAPGPPHIDFGDGSKVTASGVLQAARSLSVSSDVILYFHLVDRDQRSIVALSQEKASRLPGDHFFIQISDKEFWTNHEATTLEELRDRLQAFARAAELVEATAILLVAAEESASGERLVTLFRELTEAGLTTIIAVP